RPAMASCADILRSEFPDLDGELFAYVTGILHGSGADFESVDELEEAVGELLREVSQDTKDDGAIREICQRLFNTLQLDEGQAQRCSQVLLDAPIQLSQITDGYGDTSADLLPGLLLKRGQTSMVNAKKLEKAEARLKAKQDKRLERDSLKSSGPVVLEEASASQASSKKETRMESSGKNKSYDVRIENFDVSFGERPRIQCVGMGFSLLFFLSSLCHSSAGLEIAELSAEAGGTFFAPNGLYCCCCCCCCSPTSLGSWCLGECFWDGSGGVTLFLAKEMKTPCKYPGTSCGCYLGLCSALDAGFQFSPLFPRASVILAGLGFNAKMQQQTTKEFSGGWRMRLALARALFARLVFRPSCYGVKPPLPFPLLSEPTNMLDVRAILWLESYLQTWQSTILVVSHDRNFLNAVATDIIHLHSQRLDMYRGDFENFMKTKEERLKNQQREYEAQQQYREHIQVFIDRFRYNANRASQVQSKLKLLEKLPVLKPVDKESEVIIRFPDGFEKFSPPILQLDEVDFYYEPSHYIFHSLSVSADLESRICVVGENGAGKSTMLKILMGELAPVRGIRHAHRNLKIGYFSQHHVDQLDLNISAVELLARKFPGEFLLIPEVSFAVHGGALICPCQVRSSGMRSGVADSLHISGWCQVLGADELFSCSQDEHWIPLSQLSKLLGGIILVSHDERFIRLVCQELWVCENATVTRIEGGFDQYRDILKEQFRKEGFL
ncbi:ABCF3 protein, partial [Pomatorhinus ruficollis]|nr:ABCF3 protein [Pomatorhinus ruficollis]